MNKRRVLAAVAVLLSLSTSGCFWRMAGIDAHYDALERDCRARQGVFVNSPPTLNCGYLAASREQAKDNMLWYPLNQYIGRGTGSTTVYIGGNP